MWIEKTPTNKYKYSERYIDPVTGARKKVSITLKNNRKVDRITAQDALRARIRKESTPDGKMTALTLKELSALYYEYQIKEFKKQTAQGNKSKIKNIVEKLGPEIKASSLTAQYVRDHLKENRPETYNERLKHLRAMLRWAYREDLIDTISWLDKLKNAKTEPTRIKVQDKYLEHDELAAVLEDMTIKKWKDLTLFLALSGLRINEALSLTRDDIDLTEREIHVNKTYSPTIKEISTVKTETSYRDVYIQDELLECLVDILKYTDNFIDRKNTKTYYTYNKYFREHTEKIIKRPLTTQALRHTHVALLAEAGIPIEQITRRLGHADSKITKEVYLHITERMKERENERIKGIKLL